MSKGQQHIVPELRFPEFVEDNNWIKQRIEKACEKPFSGGTPSSTNKNFYGGDIPFIRSGEINKEQTELFLTKSGLDNSSAKMVNKGDVLIALYGANSGDVAISKINGAINQAILCLRSKSDNSFLHQYLTHAKDWITTRYLQGGQGNLSGDIIKSVELYFPKNEEQQKIAACLSSLDELITAETQKLDNLKDHKKGLLQNLFPAEGESIPKLRFPEFEKDGEWERKFLGDKKVSTFVNAKVSLNSLRIESYISTENMLPDFAGVKQANKLPATGSFTKFIDGDILVANIRPYLRKVWSATYVGAASNDVIVFRANSEIEEKFLLHLIKNDRFIDYVMKGAKGLKMPRGDKSLMKKYPISIPKRREQQKIAACLSSLDEQINDQSSRIDELKAHKKGLMQQLFPSISEFN